LGFPIAAGQPAFDQPAAPMRRPASPTPKEGQIMRRYVKPMLILLSVLFLATGCITTSSITKRFTPSETQATEAGTYSQVPASLRADVKEAEFDRSLAEKELKLAEEQKKLTELEKERAVLNDKNADLKQKLADTRLKRTAMVVEIRKLEAIDNAGLGSKEDNIKEIAALKTKELDIRSDEIKVKAEVDTTELKMKTLDKQIATQREVVAKAAGDSSVKVSKAATAKKKKK
jgi:hypothetical protein